jgi:hypothetical protein
MYDIIIEASVDGLFTVCCSLQCLNLCCDTKKLARFYSTELSVPPSPSGRRGVKMMVLLSLMFLKWVRLYVGGLGWMGPTHVALMLGMNGIDVCMMYVYIYICMYVYMYVCIY